MKTLKVIVLALIVFIMGMAVVEASSVDLFAPVSKSYTFCRDVGVLKAFRVVAYVVTVLKIMVPVVLIITGMNSFFKAFVNNDDNGTKEAWNLLFKKCMVGAVIFFIPTLISAGFGVVANYDKTEAKFSECGKCFASVKECNTLIKRYGP